MHSRRPASGCAVHTEKQCGSRAALRGCDSVGGRPLHEEMKALHSATTTNESSRPAGTSRVSHASGVHRTRWCGLCKGSKRRSDHPMLVSSVPCAETTVQMGDVRVYGDPRV